MLIEKEVIAPGEYWYVDEATGLPRKLTVTPELTKYWHEQGNKMLSAGLPVPVPYEHDFSAHPMTPKDKLLNNAGEVKEYRMKGETLWSVVDIQDPDVKKKIGHSIRWTSPWINSFTDGAGVKWDNVISHLALTTRPRVTKQEPFKSIAAALSLATATEVNEAITGGKGLCLSKALRLDDDVPAYPIAFSIASGVSLATERKRKPKGPGGGQFTSEQSASSKEAHERSSSVDKEYSSPHSKAAVQSSKKALEADSVDDRIKHHDSAAEHHLSAAKHHYDQANDKKAEESRTVAENKSLKEHHKNGVKAHRTAAEEHEKAALEHRHPYAWYKEMFTGRRNMLGKKQMWRRIMGGFSMADKPKGNPFKKEPAEGTTKKPGEEEPVEGKKPADAQAVGQDGQPVEGGEGEEEEVEEELLADQGGDMAMESILCDLLQALGVPMPDDSNEAEFKTHLYEAAMSKIKELTSQGMGKDKFKPDQNKPPNQQPNASQPQNPLIGQVQQEQQPMYMGMAMNLEDINKLTDPALKAFALSVYNDKLAADAKSAAAEKLTKSLLDSKLKEESSKREQRVLMLGKRSPTVKADLEAMQANPSFALSMGEGGAIIDPMAQTLAVLEKGLADMPRLLTIPAALLSVNDQPSDADSLTPEAEAVLVEDMARMMGAHEEKKASA